MSERVVPETSNLFGFLTFEPLISTTVNQVVPVVCVVNLRLRYMPQFLSPCSLGLEAAMQIATSPSCADSQYERFINCNTVIDANSSEAAMAQW